MKQYKVIDDRNIYRNDPTCTVLHDTEKSFVINKEETDNGGNTIKRFIMLNPKNFQDERIVDEKEAVVLKLKGVKVEGIKNEK